MKLVIVESPAKAKTIEKYLGKEYKVMSSVGHIRQIPKTKHAVDIENDFKTEYEIDPEKKKIISELKKAVKAADEVLLATDEDREGEAISWHLMEVLGLPKNTKRIVFHEITKPALETAVKNPRTVDTAMVESQQARQILDRIVGFELSPVVWQKVPGGKSAGRVQSPAVRLIVEREREINAFESKFTFKVTGIFQSDKDEIKAEYSQSFADERAAGEFLKQLIDAVFAVDAVAKTPTSRNPSPPFTTAALQIEANAKLGFSSKTTMSAAQGLYQAGKITYMRTDSVNLSAQAIGEIAGFVRSNYGEKYLKTRNFATKNATAQEAHEAIRPTHISDESAGKNNYEKRLYALIRSRTLATQMAPARLEKTVVKITTPNARGVFEAKGEIILFDGFLKVYGKAKELSLPNLQKGDVLPVKEIVARQTFAKPPARYTEGSLVKKLEELGIGRPSTYATILNTIQTRNYVKKGVSEGKEREVVQLTLHKSQIKKALAKEKTGGDKGKLVPNPVGAVLSDFLTVNFDQIVDYGFTAEVEKDFDKIAESKVSKVEMLKRFYAPFHQLVDKAADAKRWNNARELGVEPKSGKMVYAKVGRKGEYLQVGEVEKGSKEKPRFAPIPEGETVETVSLESALQQLALPALPRVLGTSDDGVELVAANGPFGPFLRAGKHNISLTGDDPYTITLERAEELYVAKKASIIADFGEVMIINGVYGPYIKGAGRRNHVKIPKDVDPKTITEKTALEMLANKKPTKSAKRRASVKRKSTSVARKNTKRRSSVKRQGAQRRRKA
ncbi:MAG: type I DNA topoisomerase [Candidatus Nomurabacteria bacterium]|jgi:DNA topoisomerase-1|nr:type I DNA topoisomerase [Candidatus Nomurabacteria bacterium]